MGNHRQDANRDMPKQYGNPSANRSSVLNMRDQDGDWSEPTEETVQVPTVRADGELFKARDRIHKKAEECRKRTLNAMRRFELAIEAKTAFYEKLSDRAESELQETTDFYNELGL